MPLAEEHRPGVLPSPTNKKRSVPTTTTVRERVQNISILYLIYCVSIGLDIKLLFFRSRGQQKNATVRARHTA